MGSQSDTPATRLRPAVAVTHLGRSSVPPGDESLGRRNAPFSNGDAVREGMRFGTVTDVGTMLVQFTTTAGISRMVCPWEIERLDASHGGHVVAPATNCSKAQ